MSVPADDPLPDAGKLPSGRLGRTARVGGLVTGQGLRWAGMRTANRLRTPERAEVAQNERTAALVNELVEQLGRMRGAAMKVGQMLSLIELDGLPAEQREALEARLASLRDDVPPVPFDQLEKLAAPGARCSAATGVRRVRRAGRGGGVDRTGPSRGDRQRERRGRQGPVPRGGRGGRDGSAQCRAAGPAGAPPGSRSRCPRRCSPSCASASARSSTMSWRRRTSAGCSGGCAGIRSSRCRGSTPSCPPAACSSRSTSEGERFEAVRRLEERSPRPLRRDRVPVLLRSAVPRSDRARRSPSGQLPVAPGRPGRVRRLRADARRQSRARRRRARHRR